MDKRKEEIAFVCTQSLINICKDLKSIGEPVLSGLALFIAKTLTDKAPSDASQVHRTDKAHNIKEEIAAAVEQVKVESNDDFGQPGD